MTISGFGRNWGQQLSFCYWCSGIVTTPSRCCSAARWGGHASVALQATDDCCVAVTISPEVCLEMIKNKTVSDLDKLLMGRGAFSQHTRDQLSVSSFDISEVLSMTTQTTLELLSTCLSLDVFSCFATWRQMAARAVFTWTLIWSGFKLPCFLFVYGNMVSWNQISPYPSFDTYCSMCKLYSGSLHLAGHGFRQVMHQPNEHDVKLCL